MKIEHKFQFVDGTFDTADGQLICIKKKKYGSVDLCFKGPPHISFAKIKLHSKDLYIDADAVFADAVILGEEIVRRWNTIFMDELIAYKWAAQCLEPIVNKSETYLLQQVADKIVAAIMQAASKQRID